MPNRHRLLSICVFAAAFVAVAQPASAQSGLFSKREKPFATISRMFLKPADRDSIARLAKQQVGLKYKMGAKKPGLAFDCSGLVQWLTEALHLEVPRTSRQQSMAGMAVPKDPSQLLPGDLLFFGKGSNVDHVGIYVGDGKFVHAANRRKGVIETAVPTGPQATTWWKSVRRLLDPRAVDSIRKVIVDTSASWRSTT